MAHWIPTEGGTSTLVGRPGAASAELWLCAGEAILRMRHLGEACRVATSMVNTFTYWANLMPLWGWARARVWVREEVAGLWCMLKR